MIGMILPDVSADDNLLERARRRDQAALHTIYERYFPAIYQFVRLRIDDREGARDITADVFLDLFMALRGKHAPRSSLRAWLFRVARNKVVDHYGQRSRFTHTALEEWMPDQGDNPELDAFRNLRIEHTRSALRMLAPDQQEVLILRFGQGLNIQETAELMDKSISAVKSLQFRAIETLRQILGVEEKE